MTRRDTRTISLDGGRGIGEAVRGPALVSKQGFGVRYDLDLEPSPEPAIELEDSAGAPVGPRGHREGGGDGQ